MRIYEDTHLNDALSTGQKNKYNNDDSEPVNTLRTFWEKDTASRYGVIDVSYSTDDISNLLSVSGRHVWFGHRNIGFGLNWAVGSGSVDTPSGFENMSAGQANLGFVLMYRPKN